MQVPQDKKRNLFIKSYGCQMNEYDSERMAEILEKHNYSSVDEPNQADLIILNTCHIREQAAEKIYSELGRLTKINRNSERYESCCSWLCWAGRGSRNHQKITYS